MSILVISRKGHQIINGNFLPSDWTYLGEVRIHPDDDQIAVFPCELFSAANNKAAVGDGYDDDVSKFCFHYVSRSIIGTTNTTAKFCMPATKKGKGHWNRSYS